MLMLVLDTFYSCCLVRLGSNALKCSHVSSAHSDVLMEKYRSCMNNQLQQSLNFFSLLSLMDNMYRHSSNVVAAESLSSCCFTT